MEWFSRVDDGDLVVPKGLDGFSPSSDSWSQYCDSTPFGNFKSEMKRNNIRSYVGAEDCKVTGNGLANDMKHFGISEEPFDNEVSQDSYCDMDQWSSYPPEQLDFHLDNMASIDQLDDAFLSSLLEDCPTGMDASDDESSELSTDDRCSMLLDDDQARDEHSNLEHMTSNSGAGTAKYFSAHAFTSPVDWEGQEDNNSYLVKKAQQAEVSVKFEHDKGDNGVSEEEISMEETVLQHLENLTSQLTDETRICFRDSLYRLADNSKHDACQSRKAMPDQESTWFSEEETKESGTNVIDRTVANLLFGNVEFGASEGSSMDFTESNITQHSGGPLWNMSGSSGCDIPAFSG